MRGRILPFREPHLTGESRVGRVRPDGAIVFRGETYPTIREVPDECVALRPDVDTYCQWVRLYSAIDPKRRRQ